MSIPIRIRRAALACLLLGATAVPAAAQPLPDREARALDQARRLIDQEWYREAVRVLNDALAGTGAAAAPGSKEQELLLLLGEAYYRSGQFPKALASIERCRRRLAAVGAVHGALGLGHEWLRADLLLARIELASGQRAAPLAADPWSDPTAPEGSLRFAQRVDLLELRMLRADLADRDGSDAAAARWTPIRAAAQQLLAACPSRADYALVALRLARCLEAENNRQEALRVLRTLAAQPLEAAESRDVWMAIARLERDLGRRHDELQAWDHALEGHTAIHPTTAAACQEHRRVEAGLHLERAEALFFAAAQADAAGDELRRQSAAEEARAVEQYVSLLRDSPSSLRTAADDRAPFQAAALQGLLHARQARQRWENRQEATPEGHDEVRTLLGLLRLLRLDDDPLVHQVEAHLGALEVRGGKYAQARQPLQQAYQYFMQRRPAPAAMLAQVQVLLSEVDRAEGNAQQAEQRLRDAQRQYSDAGIDNPNLELWLQVHWGRLAAARGRFEQARQLFLDVDRRAEILGKEAAEAHGLACLGLATLSKGFGWLDEAEAYCRKALHCRELAAGGWASPAAAADRQSLPYHLALAGVLTLRRSPEAAGEVQIAVRLAGPLPPATREAAEAWHLDALLALQRYEAAAAAAPGAEDSARHAEQVWRQLRDQQRQNAWRAEEARTAYYLSRLERVRWQRHWDSRHAEVQQYQALVRGHDALISAFRGKLRQYDDQYRAYQERERQLQRLGSQPDPQLATALRRDWEALAGLHAELERAREEIRGSQQRLPALPAAELGLLSDAERDVRAAIAILAPSDLYPSLQYMACCQLADILRTRAQFDGQNVAIEAIFAPLQQAVELLERPRVSFSPVHVEQAEFLAQDFFAQYAVAFDQLIDLSLEQGRPEQALMYAELCRSRTFLDRVRFDGYELARQDQQLTDEADRAADEAARINAELEQRFAPDARPEDSPAQATRQSLQERQRAAYRRYDQLQRQLLERSSLGRAGFGQILDRQQVQAMIDTWLQAGRAPLDSRPPVPIVAYYHVGAARSYLFLIGVEPRIRVFTLRSTELSDNFSDQVTANRVARWVDRYREALTRPGMIPQATALQKQKWLETTRQLLPAEALAKIAEAMQMRKAPLLICPAAALQRLPFEALPVDDPPAAPARYVFDCLPPYGITYAPSLMIYDSLCKASPAASPSSVLSVACSQFVGLRALPATREESSLVARCFGAQAHTLWDQAARKASLYAAVERLQPACLHLATHGIVQDDHRTALVLAPSAGAVREADRLLSISDIYNLPLAGCQLAVLSACRTNVGPERPRETDVTISRAFLSAGARRVVSSQWPIDDEATSQFVGRFVAEVADGWNCRGQTPPDTLAKRHLPFTYPAAMAAARQAVKQRYTDPFYWASFILVGPADGTPSQRPTRSTAIGAGG